VIAGLEVFMTDAAELAVEAVSVEREVGPGDDDEDGDVVAEVVIVERR
jgi:hypothetical protein